jgi:alkylation response protein AidB-like acyl-CoA dehydrogenase
MEDLKEKAKKLGLWNMFLPKNHFKEGAGFSNLEYGLMAEVMGKSGTASEVCCRRNLLVSRQGLNMLLGYELRGARYRQHGSTSQVRLGCAKEEVASTTVEWRDQIRFLDDRAGSSIV